MKTKDNISFHKISFLFNKTQKATVILNDDSQLVEFICQFVWKNAKKKAHTKANKQVALSKENKANNTLLQPSLAFAPLTTVQLLRLVLNISTKTDKAYLKCFHFFYPATPLVRKLLAILCHEKPTVTLLEQEVANRKRKKNSKKTLSFFLETRFMVNVIEAMLKEYIYDISYLFIGLSTKKSMYLKHYLKLFFPALNVKSILDKTAFEQHFNKNKNKNQAEDTLVFVKKTNPTFVFIDQKSISKQNITKTIDFLLPSYQSSKVVGVFTNALRSYYSKDNALFKSKKRVKLNKVFRWIGKMITFFLVLIFVRLNVALWLGKAVWILCKYWQRWLLVSFVWLLYVFVSKKSIETSNEL